MSESKLKIDIRRKAILDRLRSEGSVNVSELSQELGASGVTIRNDLAEMERDGELLRVRSGAVLLPKAASQVENTEIERSSEKRSIALAVAKTVQDGSTVFINTGTTMQFVASALKMHRNLNVVTNSIAIATDLGSVSGFNVVLLGGKVYAKHNLTYGTDAEAQLVRYHADVAILSIDGICAESGVATCCVEESSIDRMMLERAAHGIIAADHSKVGRAGFTNIQQSVAGLTLVTDSKCDSDALKRLEACGVTILT